MQGLFKDVCRVILSHRPLNGFIEVQDHFSLFPAADFAEIANMVSSPLLDRRLERNGPNAKFGPPFPILMQVKIPKYLNMEWELDNPNRHVEIYCNLVCLLFHQLEPFLRQNSDGVWICESGDDLARVHYRIAQQAFGFSETASLENYINAGGKRAPVFAGESYLDSVPYPKEVCSPDFLQQFFTNYEHLNERKKADFHRASFLFWQAKQIRGFGGDPNPTYVSAVECLMEEQNKEKCLTCGIKNRGLTQSYKDFLSTFASSSEEVLREQARMYDTRSKSVHGKHILSVDDHSFSSDQQAIDAVLFPWLTRKALINWLLAQNTS